VEVWSLDPLRVARNSNLPGIPIIFQFRINKPEIAVLRCASASHICLHRCNGNVLYSVHQGSAGRREGQECQFSSPLGERDASKWLADPTVRKPVTSGRT